MTDPDIVLDLDYDHPFPNLDLGVLTDRARGEGRIIRRRRRVSFASALFAAMTVAGVMVAGIVGSPGGRAASVVAPAAGQGSTSGEPSGTTSDPSISDDNVTALLRQEYARVGWPRDFPMSLERIRALVAPSAKVAAYASYDAKVAVANWAQCGWVMQVIADARSGAATENSLENLELVATQLGLVKFRQDSIAEVVAATRRGKLAGAQKFLTAQHCSSGFTG